MAENRLDDVGADDGTVKAQEGPALAEVAARLAAIEAKLERPAPSWIQRNAAWVGPMIGALATAFVFFAGYYLKDLTDQRLREAQFRLSSGEAVQAMVQRLADPGLTDQQRVAVAAALAEYGELAVAPLVRQLRVASDAHARAVAAGVRAAALIVRPRTCLLLARVFDEWRRDFPVYAHTRAVTLLGELHCTDQRAKLVALQGRVPTSLATKRDYEDHAPMDPPVRYTDVKLLRDAVATALARI